MQLDDGRIFTCYLDGTMRLWEGQIGAQILDLPDGGRSIRQLSQCNGWSSYNSVNILHFQEAMSIPTYWQGNSNVAIHSLTFDGIVVASLGTGSVICLQLYRGSAYFS